MPVRPPGVPLKSPMTPEMHKFVELLESQLGYSEKSGGYTKFGDWYGQNVEFDADYTSAPWCDMYLSWAAEKLGYQEWIGQFAYTVHHAQWFRQQDAWGTVPKPGAIVFFDWSGSDRIDHIDHVGIVTGVKGNRIHTIEGNIDGGVAKRKERDTGKVVGYGYPEKIKARLDREAAEGQTIVKPAAAGDNAVMIGPGPDLLAMVPAPAPARETRASTGPGKDGRETDRGSGSGTGKVKPAPKHAAATATGKTAARPWETAGTAGTARPPRGTTAGPPPEGTPPRTPRGATTRPRGRPAEPRHRPPPAGPRRASTSRPPPPTPARSPSPPPPPSATSPRPSRASTPPPYSPRCCSPRSRSSRTARPGSRGYGSSRPPRRVPRWPPLPRPAGPGPPPRPGPPPHAQERTRPRPLVRAGPGRYPRERARLPRPRGDPRPGPRPREAAPYAPASVRASENTSVSHGLGDAAVSPEITSLFTVASRSGSPTSGTRPSLPRSRTSSPSPPDPVPATSGRRPSPPRSRTSSLRPPDPVPATSGTLPSRPGGPRALRRSFPGTRSPRPRPPGSPRSRPPSPTSRSPPCSPPCSPPRSPPCRTVATTVPALPTRAGAACTSRPWWSRRPGCRTPLRAAAATAGPTP